MPIIGRYRLSADNRWTSTLETCSKLYIGGLHFFTSLSQFAERNRKLNASLYLDQSSTKLRSQTLRKVIVK